MIEWVAFAVPSEGVPLYADWRRYKPSDPRLAEKVQRLGRFPAPDRWAAYGEARQRWPDVPCVVVQSAVSCGLERR